MQGIIVASDRMQEWLLPWWWHHYSAYNSYPVAFVDFGMSDDAVAWCREKGTLLALPVEECALKELDIERKQRWEARWGKGIFSFRAAWFKKPLACLAAPFSINCWLDLDCQVRGNLKALFDCLTPEMDIALARELDSVQQKDHMDNYLLPEEVHYNSGVIVFRRGIDILHHWAQTAAAYNNCFLGDQTVLSRLIYLYNTPVVELPLQFNWYRQLGINSEALIIHYLQKWKLEILQELYPNFLSVFN